MRRRTTWLLVATVAAAVLALTGLTNTASAQTNSGDYGTTTTTTGGQSSVAPGSDNQTVGEGDTITINFVNLPPNTDFSATVQSTPVALPTQHSDAAGNMAVTFSTAGLEAGAHTLTVSGGGVTVVAHFTVVAAGAAATTGAPLPRTGSGSTIPLFQLGLFAIAAGGLVVLAVRRRTRHAA